MQVQKDVCAEHGLESIEGAKVLVDLVDKSGATDLVPSSECLEEVQRLIVAGAPIEVQTGFHDDSTPAFASALSSAASWGSLRLVQEFIYAGAQLDVLDECCWTPIMNAIADSSDSILNAEFGLEDGREIVFTLIRAKADLDPLWGKPALEERANTTALTLAVHDAEITRALIDAKAQLEGVDRGTCSSGVTALELACGWGMQELNMEVATALVEAGAHMDDAMYDAAHDGPVELVKLLIAHGGHGGMTRCHDSWATAMFAALHGHRWDESYGDTESLEVARLLAHAPGTPAEKRREYLDHMKAHPVMHLSSVKHCSSVMHIGQILQQNDENEAALVIQCARRCSVARAKSNSLRERHAVRAWLSEKGLEELAPVFVARDYCDVDLMKKIGLDNDDLDFLEIHDAKKRAILLGKQPPAPAPAPAHCSMSEFINTNSPLNSPKSSCDKGREVEPVLVMEKQPVVEFLEAGGPEQGRRRARSYTSRSRRSSEEVLQLF